MTTRDLGEEIFQLLQRYDFETAQRWRSLFLERQPAWCYGPLPVESVQLSLINDFWNTQLGLLQENTFDERRYLSDDLSPDTWLYYFEHYVLDKIQQNRLPSISLS